MKRTFSLFLFTLFVCSLSASAQYRRIITLAGKGGTGAYSGDGYTALNAFFNGPDAVALDKAGNVYIVDFYNNRVRKVFKSTGQVVNFAGTGIGGYGGDGSAATSADMVPQGVAADMRGNVFISDANTGVVRKVNLLGIITTYAGGNGYGYSGDGGPATHAKLSAPSGLFTDGRSNLYICDAANHVIRKVDTFGVITTVAGNDTAGYAGDGGFATDARLDSPYAVAVDKHGSIYIADHNNNVIRKVDATTGIISTIAGIAGSYGYTGDHGLATAATLNNPKGIAVDTSLNIYISDADNNVIRKVDTGGIITTSVGNGYPGFGGDLGDPLGANIFSPYGLAVDISGSLYIADANNQRVRKVYFTTLGVDDVVKVNGVGVYPNPIENEINVTGLSINDKICIYDHAGRAVSATWTVTNTGLQTFGINNLADGIYALQVIDNAGNKKATVKLVK
jgi:hypothetical protein